MRRLTLLPLLALLVGCGDSTGPLEETAVPDAAHARAAPKADKKGPNMAALAQHMVDNGRTNGAFFLPPFEMDDEGNVTFAGSGGFIFAGFWPSGALRGLCFFGSTSETNFFRVGPKEYAMNHVNGAADAGLFLRFSEDGEPLPPVGGTGKLNMKVQGKLMEDRFYDDWAGVWVTFLYIDEPTSAQVWSGVAKVGPVGEKPDQLLRCGFTEDAKGNRRSQVFSLK